jgi:hypothetical protein
VIAPYTALKPDQLIETVRMMHMTHGVGDTLRLPLAYQVIPTPPARAAGCLPALLVHFSRSFPQKPPVKAQIIESLRRHLDCR